MSPPDVEERFIALEMKVADQEKLLAELNDVLVEHSNLLREITLRANSLERAVRDSMDQQPANEKPPHY